MSLIGDALRKARQEAAERESDRKGILFSAKIADSPTRSNLGLGLALGALIAVIATVAGGGAVWWIVGRGTSPEPGSVADPTPPTIAAAAPTPTDIPTSPAPSTEPVATEEIPRIELDRPPKDASEPTDPPAQALESQPDESGQPPLTETEYIPETGFIGREDGEEIYLLEADLGDVSLSLDFLVFREVDPFAEINGVEVHLGATIDGYRVKDIERDRVRLSNGRRTIVLRAP